MEERYAYVLDKYAAEFAETVDLERAILGRLRAAGVPAEQYDQSKAFAADWSGPDFMAVSSLKDKMESYVVHLCSQLPDVVALSRRVSSQAPPKELYLLLEANEFDLDAAAAAVEARESIDSSQNCMEAFDRDPELQHAIAKAEQEILQDAYPDYHLILGPDDCTDAREGRLYLSNERFVGHVAIFEQGGSSHLGGASRPAEAAHRNLTEINCKFIVCCVDRPKVLEDRGYRYCQVPLGDAPSAAAELPGKMREAFDFIDGARGAGENVIVHCNVGMSRSATIVIGYLMSRLGWSYKRAYHHTKLRRGIIRPNDAFESVLQRLEVDVAVRATVENRHSGADAAARSDTIRHDAMSTEDQEEEWQLVATVSDSHSGGRPQDCSSIPGTDASAQDRAEGLRDEPANGMDHRSGESADAPPVRVAHTQSTRSSSRPQTVPLAVAITPGRPQRVDLGHSPVLGPLPPLDGPLSSEVGGALGGALAKHQRLKSVPADTGASVSDARVPGSPAESVGDITNASFRTVALTPSSTVGGMDSSMAQRNPEISGVFPDYMADCTDDESIPDDDSSNTQDNRNTDSTKARSSRWRCCSSGRPPPITEAVEDATEDTTVKAPQLGQTAVLAPDIKSSGALQLDQQEQKQDGEDKDEQQQDREEEEGKQRHHHYHHRNPAGRRWCGSTICATGFEDRAPNTAEDSFAVQERHIEAVGGLQRLGSTYSGNAEPPAAPVRVPGTEHRLGADDLRLSHPDSEIQLDPELEPLPLPQTEPELQVELEQSDMGDSALLQRHKRTDSGVIKM